MKLDISIFSGLSPCHDSYAINFDVWMILRVSKFCINLTIWPIISFTPIGVVKVYIALKDRLGTD